MMKKLLTAILSLAMLLSLAACGASSFTSQPESSDVAGTASSAPSASENRIASSTETTTGSEAPSSTSETNDEKALVIYFSWSGNTKAVAEEIQSQTDAEIFALSPQTPYTEDYIELLDIAQEEKGANARPAISGEIENFDAYSVVYVGFPNWWSDMPMLLYTMFDSYDFSGKTLVPFVTSGGSGFSNTIESIKTLEQDATVLEGLALTSGEAADSADEVSEWLTSIGLAD